MIRVEQNAIGRRPFQPAAVSSLFETCLAVDQPHQRRKRIN
jgi:hypothetical protein